jgi:trigger factor
MYGQSVFQDEVLRSAGRQLEDYLTNEKIAIFGQPMLMPQESPLHLDMNNPQEMQFSFEIGLLPEFEVPALDGKHTLVHYKVKVSDAMVDDEVARLQKRSGHAEDVEVISHKENMLKLQLQAANEAGEAVEGGYNEDRSLSLEHLPENLQEQLMGKKVGDTLVFKPSEVCTEAELVSFMTNVMKGMDASEASNQVLLTIHSIQVQIPRQLDALFFGEIFPNDNILDESAFREKLRQELGQHYNRLAENRMNDEIFEILVHTTPIDLPVPFLKRWMAEGQEKRLSPEQVEHDFPGFNHQLRWTLISDKLIRDANLNVSQEEVINELKTRVLGYFGMEAGEEAPWMDAYMQKMAKDEKTMNETYRQMLFGRLFENLRGRFLVEEKEVAEEEFFALPSPHAAHHHDH